MTVIQGTPFEDTLTGMGAPDFFYGWQGNDVLDGESGDDILYGDSGNDTLIGGHGNDFLGGSEGNDRLQGDEGNDIVYGGMGDDRMLGGLGSDRLVGDRGNDTFLLDFGSDTVTGGQDRDTYILAPTLGGDTEAQAAIVTDFNPSEDKLQLTGGLTFDRLNIYQGSGVYRNHTIVQHKDTNRFLAILLDVSSPSILEAGGGNPPVEPQVQVQAPEEPEASLPDRPMSDPAPLQGETPTPPPAEPTPNPPPAEETPPSGEQTPTPPPAEETPPSGEQTHTPPPAEETPTTPPGEETPANTAPENILLSNSSIAEKSSDGTPIATLATTDADSEDTHTYRLIDDAGGSFALEENQLIVANGALLDFETNQTHSITVQTTDSAGNTFEKSFTMSVTEVKETIPNRAPTDIVLSKASIAENSSEGTAIGTLTTTDPDAGDTHSYLLVDSASGRFAIAGDQLTVANSEALDFETATSDRIVVRTTDAAGDTFTKTLTVAVENANEAPTDLSVSNLVVREDSINGSAIGTITPTDPDTTDTHTYSLLDNAEGRFAISGNQLTVADGSLLDYETATSHEIVIRTTDAGGNHFERAFAVSVGDVSETLPNTAPTDIAIGNTTIAENSANGTVVGDLTTADPNAGDTHSYSLVDDAGGRFAISGTQIAVADSSLLDYEAGNQSELTIRTTDARGLTFDKTFAISVTDRNEAPTDLAVSNTVVDENSANGTEIGTMTTTDPDSGDTHAYSLVDNAGGRFGIVGDRITVADGTRLDYETENLHQIVVRSTDGAGQTVDKAVTIALNNLNEPPIAIANSPLSVNRLATVGIGNNLLQVTDPEQSATQLTYTLVNAPTNGQLKLNGTPLFGNDTFTQADIDSDRLTYTHGILKLSHNYTNDTGEAISGSNAVWSRYNGDSSDIMFYDGNTVKSIYRYNDTHSLDPQISGSNVVWEAYDGNDWEIFFYDGNATRQVTDNTTDDRSPQISGSNLVWEGVDGLDREIFFYDGNGITQLSDNLTPDFDPTISGSNVAWVRLNGLTEEIFFYDGNSSRNISQNLLVADRVPQISGSNVVWETSQLLDNEISFYDGNATTLLTNNLTNDQSPQISGSQVVWYGPGGTDGGLDNEIFFYDGTSVTQLTTNDTDDFDPHISNSNVVWHGSGGIDGGSDNEIFFYDGTNVTQLTANAMNDDYPQLSGANAVWSADDGDSEIFFSPMAGASASDRFIFSVSDGVGGMLENAAFDINVI
ncbi:cadherin domain-containing protein [Phormidium sp. CCY1219]|uniref:cadherin domain-containing protein n=1 Tax=Phormidium sp. CCY1219 TaxID=2886104 RepID=UPI002D1ED532|nr:cadherin domain-containing protein [Phormidium sp. CCY1219]MEB3831704.1 cadherin domain-containing protein [Phormidium sp. CCY1219]